MVFSSITAGIHPLCYLTTIVPSSDARTIVVKIGLYEYGVGSLELEITGYILEMNKIVGREEDDRQEQRRWQRRRGHRQCQVEGLRDAIGTRCTSACVELYSTDESTLVLGRETESSEMTWGKVHDCVLEFVVVVGSSTLDMRTLVAMRSCPYL